MSVQLYLSVFVMFFIIISVISIYTSYKVMKRDFDEKIKLDITVEQMIESEQRIKNFLEANNIKRSEAVPKMAKIFKVDKGGIEKGLYTQAYIKEIDKQGRKIVVFKEGLSKEDERFAFAHEIAHILNKDKIPATRPTGRNKPHIEQRADYTAAALIMPLDEVYDYLVINNYNQISTRKRVTIVRKLCKKYGVSEMIALRRVNEVKILKQTMD